MSNDIDKVLAEASLKSKFGGAVEEFVDLLGVVGEYIDAEERVVDSQGGFTEDEIDAMDKVVADLMQLERDLREIHKMVKGGLG